MNLLNKYRYRFITFGGMACPTTLRSCRNASSIGIAPLQPSGGRSAGLIEKKNASSMPKTKIAGALFAEVDEQNACPTLHMHGCGTVQHRHGMRAHDLFAGIHLFQMKGSFEKCFSH